MTTQTRKPTCGPLYLDGLRHYAGEAPEKIRLFAAGFVSGEAEKVYLGACKAAMFRPSPEYLRMVQEIVIDVVLRYGLGYQFLYDEVWITRDADAFRLVTQLHQTEVNSPEWHSIRASLCGVPPAEVDERFHERKGYGERCD